MHAVNGTEKPVIRRHHPNTTMAARRATANDRARLRNDASGATRNANASISIIVGSDKSGRS
jgi:hypothetical protein